MPVAVSELKPGRSLAFERCAAQFAGRTLILEKQAVATPRDVLAPTPAYVLDFCKAFGLLLLGAARP